MAAARLSGWQKHSLASDALRGNPLGDPHERDLWVWSPPDRSRRYPSVYVLHAHMRSVSSWFNVEPFERSYPEEIDALAPEAVVVLVDGWTSVGGSQWIDSAGIGAYGTYLCDEVVSFVDEHYPTNGARGIQGKSSGGTARSSMRSSGRISSRRSPRTRPTRCSRSRLAHGFPALRASSASAVSLRWSSSGSRSPG